MTVETKAPAHLPYRLDEQVGYLLRLANQRHANIFVKHALDGVTATQFAALSRLLENGKCSQNQLGRLAGMDVATIKGVVDRLRSRKLVAVEPSPDDRRRTLISLTGKGERLTLAMQQVGHTITAETLEPLTPAEQRSLVCLLGKIS